MKKPDKNYDVMSIRNRILLFSVLVTLLPSFSMGWMLNNIMHATITEKIEQQLIDSASIIEREIALWYKERTYDLHVFSNSFVISENLSKYLYTRSAPKGKAGETYLFTRKIETYLSSVQKQFDDYTRLLVLDNEGAVVASSVTADVNASPPIQLPEDISEQIAATKSFTGEIHFQTETNSPLMLIGIPLFSDQYDEQIGLLAVEVRLQAILPLLEAALANTQKDIYLSGSLIHLKDGHRFLSNHGSVGTVALPKEILQLFNSPLHLQDFVDFRGVRVVGLASPIEQLHWGLIIKVNHDAVFAKVIQSRDRNILIVCSFALVIGFAAYLLARQIIKPLKTLTNGALQVANGDLNVQLPILKNDELGFTTRVFNEMVVEVQQTNAKLKQLATTDNLTKLANRKLIMENLLQQFECFHRYKTAFSILMVDLDHFKNINDTYGHQAGDTVLRQVGEIFLDALRNVDIAGRYGGEEFLIILTETDGENAAHTAERIRTMVREHSFAIGDQPQITASLGVATVLKEDANEGSLIDRADRALCQAKENGRDQIVYLADNTSTHSGKEKVVSFPCAA